MDGLSQGKRNAALQAQDYLVPQGPSRAVRFFKFCGRALGWLLYWLGRGLMWLGESLKKVSEITP